MAWTYDPTSTADRDVVRRYIGDTNANDHLLDDEELDPYIAAAPDLHASAADAITFGIIPRLARDVDRSNLGVSSTRSQKIQHYRDLAEALRSRAGVACEAYGGGISVADTAKYEADTDLTLPRFYRGQHGGAR